MLFNLLVSIYSLEMLGLSVLLLQRGIQQGGAGGGGK